MADDLSAKLNSILSNEAAMGQIMSLAKSLEGDPAPAEPQGTAEEPSKAPQSAPPDLSGLLSALGGDGIDPKWVGLGATLLGEYHKDGDKRTALLQALRPFVKPERYAKLDRAVEAARLAHMAQVASEQIKSWGGEGNV